MVCIACAENERQWTKGKSVASRLESLWFGKNRRIMALVAISVLLMVLRTTERTGVATSILIFRQHIFW